MNVVRMLRSTLDLLGAMGGSLPTDERVSGRGPVHPRARDRTPRSPSASTRPSAPRRWPRPGAGVLPRRRLRPRRPLHRGAALPALRGRGRLRGGVGRLPPGPRAPLPRRRRRLLRRARVDRGARRGARTSTRAGSESVGAAPAERWRRPSPSWPATADGPALAVQILNYPVIDDRMADPVDAGLRRHARCGRAGPPRDMWQHYLGDPDQRGDGLCLRRSGARHGPDGPPARLRADRRARPACATRASTTPRRLMEAGVPTELHTVAGACHGFDIIAARGHARTARHRRAGARPGAGTAPRYRLTLRAVSGTGPIARHEPVEQDPGRTGDVVDGALEGRPVGLGRGAIPAHLPDVLQGGSPHVLVGNGLGAPQGHDASAHPDTVPHRDDARACDQRP